MRQTEIRDPQLAATIHHQVARLHITVHDSLLVGAVQRPSRLDSQADDVPYVLAPDREATSRNHGLLSMRFNFRRVQRFRLGAKAGVGGRRFGRADLERRRGVAGMLGDNLFDGAESIGGVAFPHQTTAQFTYHLRQRGPVHQPHRVVVNVLFLADRVHWHDVWVL